MFTFRVSYIVYFLFLVCFRVVTSLDLEKGDQCSFNGGTQGICKVITSCQYAYDALEHGIFFPENICGFEGKTPIVCCQQNDSVTTPTPIVLTTTMPTPQPTSTPTETPKSPVTLRSKIAGEISKEKCKEYARYAFKRKQSTTSVRPPHSRTRRIVIPQIKEILECGFDKLNVLIGGLATSFEFPHMALIGFQPGDKVRWLCGGSLISENFILTAAHCLKNYLVGSAKFVRIGLTNQTDLTNMQERTVSDLIPYPEYAERKYHDIGLLKVSKSFDFSPYARPACLQVEKTIPSRQAIASGWGKITYSGQTSNDLLKVVLEFFDTKTCNKTYRRDINATNSNLKDGIIEDLMICAGSKTDLKDTCQGDSGGPLQVYHEDTKDIKCMYSIIGITSFGKLCGLSNVPGVYTRVSTYIKWIEDTVWP